MLKSPDPTKCFEDKNTKPDTIVAFLLSTIWETGELQALKEASKLQALRFDATRFHSSVPDEIESLVADTMTAASGGNRFKLAYQALELGDTGIETRALAWLDQGLSEELPKIGKPVFDIRRGTFLGEWAEALVDRYGDVPSATQLFKDPIASRLRPELNALHYQFGVLPASRDGASS